MSNRLEMADIQAIIALHKKGWRNRRIARELEVDRATVAKYVRASRCAAKPAKAPIGSDVAGEQGRNGLARPLEGERFLEETGIDACRASPCREYHPPIQNQPDQPAVGAPPIGSEAVFEGAEPVEAALESGSESDVFSSAFSMERECGRSACEAYRRVILEKLEQGLTAQRIYQDLVAEGFAWKYHSVRRFVAKLRKTSPLPFRRMECEPGEEAQVDFGTGAWIEQPGGRRRRPHVFRFVLSYSRKGYSKATYRQTTEDFIRCLENAFWHFGGVDE